MDSTPPQRRCARFAQFELDLPSGDLRRAGRRVHISGQPLRILTHLLERRGELVTRDELHRELWSDDTFVDFDRGLNTAIKRLRAALGDSATHPRYIETLPRKGYRLLVQVAWMDDARQKPSRPLWQQPATRVGLALLPLLAVVVWTGVGRHAPDDVARPSRSALTSLQSDGPEPDRVTAAFLKGRYHLGRGTEEDFASARSWFEQSLAINGTHAPSHAGLADYYILTDTLAPRDAFARAHDHAASALALDPRLADAHASLAFTRYYGTWDWTGAGAAFREALRLDPGHTRARRWHALFLSGMGRHDEALAEAERAMAMDPVSLVNHDARAAVLFNARRFDDASTVGRAMIALDANDVRGYEHVVLAAIQLGRASEAMDMADEALRRHPHHPLITAFRAVALARAGHGTEASATLDALRRTVGAGTGLSEGLLAFPLAGADQRAHALDLLERAYARHDPYLVLLRVSPWFDALRDDPRYRRLVNLLAYPDVIS